MMKKFRLPFLILLANALLISILYLANLQIQPALAKNFLDESSTPTPTPFPEVDLGETPPLYPAPLAIKPNDHFYFTRPLAIDTTSWKASYFRYGRIEIDSDIPHTGLDIGLEEGTPVYAAASGTIIWADYGIYLGGQDINDPYGIAIAIQHDFGFEGENLYTIYGHLSETVVRRGQKVEMGDLIAYSGNTGISSAPHLHYEIRLGLNSYFNSLNPELWTVPPQGTGVLVGNMTSPNGQRLLWQEISISNLETGIVWYGRTYGSNEVIGFDPYFEENIVISEIPTGEYQLYVPYEEYYYYYRITIEAGTITYFHFDASNELDTDFPEIPIPSNLPISNP